MNGWSVLPNDRTRTWFGGRDDMDEEQKKERVFHFNNHPTILNHRNHSGDV